jgi:hypothetical protein
MIQALKPSNISGTRILVRNPAGLDISVLIREKLYMYFNE